MNDLIESVWRTSTRPVGSVRSLRSGQPIIVLTFDDGPSPDSTEGLLDALAQFGASATFFVVMTRVRRSPDLLAAIISAGHEVALHGPDHVRLTRLPFREIVERSRAAKVELEDLTGRAVRWIRPPYGSQSLRSWAAVRRAGLTPVMWGGTTWDWKDEPMERRMTKVMSDVAPGQHRPGARHHRGTGGRRRPDGALRPGSRRVHQDVARGLSGSGHRGREPRGGVGWRSLAPAMGLVRDLTAARRPGVRPPQAVVRRPVA